MPVTDPEPAAVPVKVTEQLPDDRVQLVALSVPGVPADKVKLTLPVGMFDALVVSVTVAVTVAVQLVAPSAILQLTLATLVDVPSLPVAVTVTIATELMLPL
jgi:hypothetical protein